MRRRFNRILCSKKRRLPVICAVFAFFLIAIETSAVVYGGEWRATYTLEGAVAPAIVRQTGGVDHGVETSYLGLGRLRLGARISHGRSFSFEAGHETHALWGAAVAGSSLELRAPPALRLDDLKQELYSSDEVFLGHNLDRLSATFRIGGVVLSAGRQAISHGSGRFFNPSDLFAPLDPLASFTEYKAGIDALRVSKPIGERVEIEAYAVAHERRTREGLLLGRARALLSGVDLSVLAGTAFGAPACALDVSGDWGGVGWYGEAAARLRGDHAPIIRAMAGISYRFRFGLTLTAELFENGIGESQVADYGRVLTAPETRNGQSFFLASHYSALLLEYEIHPLIKGELAWVQNYVDGSALLMPRVVWDASDRVTLSAVALASLGPGLRLERGSLAPAWQSEFGLIPELALFEARFSY